MIDEDIKILNLIISKLTEKYDEDVSGFRVESCDGYDEFEYDDDRSSRHRSKYLTIRWKPKNYSWKASTYDYDYDVQLRYNISEQTVSITIGIDSRHIFIGGGSENKDIKIKFVKLYKGVKAWQEVDIPRKEREKFINATTKTFPDILDHLIMEDSDEEE